MAKLPFTPPRAMLVDLDDTILDDSSNVHSAWQEVCVAATSDLPGVEAEALLAAIARVRDWYWSDPARHREGRQDLRAASARIVHAALTSLGYDNADVARSIAHAYRDRRDAAVQLLPGAVETLEGLAARGIRLALLTNGAGPVQRAKVQRFDLGRHFDYILIEGEFGVGKPDERVYHAAMAALASRPSETWMVGDNLEWEVLVPGRLGLQTVWVDRRGRGLPAGSLAQPTHVVSALREIIGLL